MRLLRPALLLCCLTRLSAQQAGPAATQPAIQPDTSAKPELRLADLKPSEWVKLQAVLADKTTDSGLSGRSWNNLRYDPQGRRYYVWEGWSNWHSDARYGFPYTPRPYHIYSDALYSFALPADLPGSKVVLEIEALSCWRWRSGKEWVLRDPGRDHPKMKTPSPKDRHPFNGTALDTKRDGLWQFGGVNMGGGIGWLSDLWFFDIAKGQWKELDPPKRPPVAGATAAVYVPDRDTVFCLVQSPGELGVWEYDIARNEWIQATDHKGKHRLDWDALSVVYDPRRKQCHFFSTLPTGDKDADGKPLRALNLLSCDPTTGKMQASGPVRSPQGYWPEMALDTKRDRIVCLRPADAKAQAGPMELWCYDFRANEFRQVSAGGDAPPRQSGAPRTLAWDEHNDLYVVWRIGTIYLFRPQANPQPATDLDG